MSRTVCMVLRKPVVRQLGFRIPDSVWVLYAHQFEDIARAVERGRIIVYENVRLAQRRLCKYTFNENGQNVLRIGAPHLTSMTNQAGLIHEAVHAIQDWNRKVIEEIDDEATAYIAQFLYIRRLTGVQMFPPDAWGSDQAFQNLGVIGYFIADAIVTQNPDRITQGVITQMRQAIEGTGFYQAGRIKAYDGI